MHHSFSILWGKCCSVSQVFGLGYISNSIQKNRVSFDIFMFVLQSSIFYKTTTETCINSSLTMGLGKMYRSFQEPLASNKGVTNVQKNL